MNAYSNSAYQHDHFIYRALSKKQLLEQAQLGPGSDRQTGPGPGLDRQTGPGPSRQTGPATMMRHSPATIRRLLLSPAWCHPAGCRWWQSGADPLLEKIRSFDHLNVSGRRDLTCRRLRPFRLPNCLSSSHDFISESHSNIHIFNLKCDI